MRGLIERDFFPSGHEPDKCDLLRQRALLDKLPKLRFVRLVTRAGDKQLERNATSTQRTGSFDQQIDLLLRMQPAQKQQYRLVSAGKHRRESLARQLGPGKVNVLLKVEDER